MAFDSTFPRVCARRTAGSLFESPLHRQTGLKTPKGSPFAAAGNAGDREAAMLGYIVKQADGDTSWVIRCLETD